MTIKNLENQNTGIKVLSENTNKIRKIKKYAAKLFTRHKNFPPTCHLKGTVSQKLPGVKSGINR